MLFPENMLADVGLRYAATRDLSVKRKRDGDDVIYVDPVEGKVRSKDRLNWYNGLAVPPAYKNVVFSARKNTHLQAKGTDTTGSIQYFYHPLWEDLRDRYKFDRLITIGGQLPRIRRAVRKHLARSDKDKLYVLAAITRVLDRTGLRVGNPRSSQENKTYGVTTLQAEHINPKDNLVTLEFTGKGGVEIERDIEDSGVAHILENFYSRPGKLLFQYSENGDFHAVSPAQINNFISKISGIDMTAKEFRTWRASALFVKFWLKKGGDRKTLSALLDDVAAYICNTPATLRSSYIHPLLIAHKKNDDFHIHDIKPHKRRGLRKAENVMMSILTNRDGPDG